MSRTVRTGLLTLLAVVVIGGGAVALVAWLGLIDISAAGTSSAAVNSALGMIRDRSIAHHARAEVDRGQISPPPKITDALLERGAGEYKEMCVICHGGPGVKPTAIGRGLEPDPPDLSHTAREMNASEIYWVIENGIRHTGMPSFGKTHDAETLWAITAFVSRFKDMSPEEFSRRTTAGPHEEHREHDEHDEHDANEHAK